MKIFQKEDTNEMLQIQNSPATENVPGKKVQYDWHMDVQVDERQPNPSSSTDINLGHFLSHNLCLIKYHKFMLVFGVFFMIS